MCSYCQLLTPYLTASYAQLNLHYNNHTLYKHKCVQISCCINTCACATNNIPQTIHYITLGARTAYYLIQTYEQTYMYTCTYITTATTYANTSAFRYYTLLTYVLLLPTINLRQHAVSPYALVLPTIKSRSMNGLICALTLT